MIVVSDESEIAKLAARPAITRVEPVRRVGDFTLVSVTPSTGMRHQIRVHLADAGFPIVGDDLYGGAPSELGAGTLLAASVGNRIRIARVRRDAKYRRRFPSELARLLT